MAFACWDMQAAAARCCACATMAVVLQVVALPAAHVSSGMLMRLQPASSSASSSCRGKPAPTSSVKAIIQARRQGNKQPRASGPCPLPPTISTPCTSAAQFIIFYLLF